MLGLDDSIAGLSGGGLAMALVVAVLLGIRHATDPDHLTAISTLVLSGRRSTARRAGTLGLAWGLGHALTLVVLGLPVVLIGRQLPGAFEKAAELAVGLLIVALACRLLVRWRRGYFHAHPHTHGAVTHAHPHVHEHAGGEEHSLVHAHSHAESLGRSPLAAFGIGLLHGAGGSAAVGVLIVGATPGRAASAVALALFAAATAASMVAVTTLFGHALRRTEALRRLVSAVPVFGALSLSFGLWYALAAL